MQYTGRLSPDEFWAQYAKMEDRVRAAAGILPYYGMAEWSGLRAVSDCMWQDDDLVTVGLAHGHPDGDGPMVHVRTTVHDPRQEGRSLRMTRAGPPRDKQDFRRRHREIDTEPGEQTTIPVEATGVLFAVWHEAERWWAAGSHDDHGLVLEARRVSFEQVRLVCVHDIEPYLTESRAHLRAMRGES